MEAKVSAAALSRSTTAQGAGGADRQPAAGHGEGRARQEVDETIENLVFYVRYHFAWEEQWYDQHGFKGLAAHTAEHELLTRDVIQLQTRLQEGKLVAAVPLMRLLQGWLLTHIDGSDKAAVAAVLRAQDAAAPISASVRSRMSRIEARG